MICRPTMHILEKFKQALEEEQLIHNGDSLLVALSGGPDSVALLHLLTQVQDSYDLEVRAAHINHKLRGRESELDQDFVKALCRSKGIPLDIHDAPVNNLASGNTENVARTLRYELLAEIAGKQGAIVATGHTLDDQAETFLMKLIRGSGTSGLSGIYAKRIHRSARGISCRIIRPLLFARKMELIDYLKREELDFRVDQSNRNLEFDRNWVRHQLIPMLEKRLNPELAPTLARTALLMNEVEELLELQARRFCKEHSRRQEEDLLVDLTALKNEQTALQKQVVRHIMKLQLDDLAGIISDHTRAVLQLAANQSGREVHLPRGLRVIREFDELRFSLKSPVEDFAYPLKIPGELYIPEVAKRIKIEKNLRRSKSSGSLTLADRQVTIRNRRPGDSYRRFQDQEPVSLKETFMNERIPITERKKRLIVEASEGIKWVEGLPPENSSNTDEKEDDSYHVVVLIETF